MYLIGRISVRGSLPFFFSVDLVIQVEDAELSSVRGLEGPHLRSCPLLVTSLRPSHEMNGNVRLTAMSTE